VNNIDKPYLNDDNYNDKKEVYRLVAPRVWGYKITDYPFISAIPSFAIAPAAAFFLLHDIFLLFLGGIVALADLCSNSYSEGNIQDDHLLEIVWAHTCLDAKKMVIHTINTFSLGLFKPLMNGCTWYKDRWVSAFPISQ